MSEIFVILRILLLRLLILILAVWKALEILGSLISYSGIVAPAHDVQFEFASVGCTSVPPAQFITDAAGNVWSLSEEKQVVRNGILDTSTHNVELLMLYSGIVYQKSVSRWLAWRGNHWVYASAAPARD